MADRRRKGPTGQTDAANAGRGRPTRQRRTDPTAERLTGSTEEPAARRQPRTGPRAPLSVPERIRVTVWLDRKAVEDLQLLARYRHGEASRSATVRRAVEWLLAKEAAWLTRERRAEQLRQDAAAELRRALALPRDERERLDREATIAGAVKIARGNR